MILEAALFQLTHNGKICISKTQNTHAGVTVMLSSKFQLTIFQKHAHTKHHVDVV